MAAETKTLLQNYKVRSCLNVCDYSMLVTLYEIALVNFLSLAWHEWFSCKGKAKTIYCCGLEQSSGPQKGV